jgi:hypothetical protein
VKDDRFKPVQQIKWLQELRCTQVHAAPIHHTGHCTWGSRSSESMYEQHQIASSGVPTMTEHFAAPYNAACVPAMPLQCPHLSTPSWPPPPHVQCPPPWNTIVVSALPPSTTVAASAAASAAPPPPSIVCSTSTSLDDRHGVCSTPTFGLAPTAPTLPSVTTHRPPLQRQAPSLLQIHPLCRAVVAHLADASMNHHKAGVKLPWLR